MASTSGHAPVNGLSMHDEIHGSGRHNGLLDRADRLPAMIPPFLDA